MCFVDTSSSSVMAPYRYLIVLIPLVIFLAVVLTRSHESSADTARDVIIFAVCMAFIAHIYIRYVRRLPPSCRGHVGPVPEDPWLKKSATELAAALRRGDVTSTYLVQASLAHLERVDPGIHSVTYVRREDALKEAADADAQLDKARKNRSIDSLPQFLGVPSSLKEFFAHPPHPRTSGHIGRKSHIPDREATVVTRMKDAGFIFVCGTNTSEMGMWMESQNLVHGVSCNPYDYTRTPGGSSGGEGAAISAGIAPVGVGSDVGGSIRMPSFFNGIFGHKPTSRTVPNSGQHPVSRGEVGKYLCTGPMVRHAADLYPLLSLMRGADDLDLTTQEVPSLPDLPQPSSVDISKLTVYVVKSNGAMGLSPSSDIQKTIDVAARHLATKGCTIKVVDWKDASTVPKGWGNLSNSLDIWSAMMTQNPVTFTELMANGDESFSPAWEFLRWLCGFERYTLAALVLCFLEKTYAWMPKRLQRFIEMGGALKNDIHQVLQSNNGVILFPPYTMVTPHHYRPLLFPVQWQYTAIWNALEFPVTQIPMGLDEHGLPLGVQCVADMNMDHVSIAVALELERAFGGHVPPRRLCS
eukprot:PhM_4_TR9555/c0_g1_i1/m.89879/K19176/FAAH2; fatty acid amide hydrolase 2